MDGFMDTCDALASHAGREQKLAILKDSHVGAFAVLGCALYLLASDAIAQELLERVSAGPDALAAMQLRVLPGAACVQSRLLSALAVATFPIAKDSGLVHTFASASDRRTTALWSLGWYVALSTLLCTRSLRGGLALTLSSLAVFAAYFAMARRNFGGITGDTAGWFVQLSELCALTSFTLLC